MNKNTAGQEMVEVTVESERSEALGGVLVAFFAALMAVAGLINGNYEEEMMIAHNTHTAYSSWYQSKSIKQSLKESELVTLNHIAILGNISSDEMYASIKKINTEIERYGKEKKEILLGSNNVGKENWIQDLDGELGQIVGVKELEQIAEKYDNATKKFDISILFFQICIVLGAVCIIIYDNPPLQKAFIKLMILCGVIGIGFATYGYIMGI